MNPPHYYKKESSRDTAITKKLSIFVGTTNVPFSLVVKNSMNYFMKWMASIKYLIEKEFLKRSARYTIIYKKQFDRCWAKPLSLVYMLCGQNQV